MQDRTTCLAKSTRACVFPLCLPQHVESRATPYANPKKLGLSSGVGGNPIFLALQFAALVLLQTERGGCIRSHASPSIVQTYAKAIDEHRRDAIRKLESLRPEPQPSASPSAPYNFIT